MNELIEALKLILGILTLALVIFTLFAVWRFARNIKAMDQKSTGELKAIICDRNKQFTFAVTIKELRKRNEDYSEVLPHLLDMSISKTKMDRLIGWGLLETNFPEITKEIEYDPMKPSKQGLQFLTSLKHMEINQAGDDNSE